jgi:hypothetical protein
MQGGQPDEGACRGGGDGEDEGDRREAVLGRDREAADVIRVRRAPREGQPYGDAQQDQAQTDKREGQPTEPRDPAAEWELMDSRHGGFRGCDAVIILARLARPSSEWDDWKVVVTQT